MNVLADQSLGDLARDVVECMDDGFWSVDRDWHVVFANSDSAYPVKARLRRHDGVTASIAGIATRRCRATGGLSHLSRGRSGGRPDRARPPRRRAANRLAFTDVVLPGGVDGHTLAERARAVHAELKVLLTTGYIRGGSAERARIGPDVELIVKLFTPRALAEKIGRLLEQLASRRVWRVRERRAPLLLKR
jgi:hypothetical protein